LASPKRTSLAAPCPARAGPSATPLTGSCPMALPGHLLTAPWQIGRALPNSVLLPCSAGKNTLIARFACALSLTQVLACHAGSLTRPLPCLYKARNRFWLTLKSPVRLVAVRLASQTDRPQPHIVTAPHGTACGSPSGARCPQKPEHTREADLSAQQTRAQAPPRLPLSYVHRWRPPCHRCSPCARPQEAVRLSRAALASEGLCP